MANKSKFEQEISESEAILNVYRESFPNLPGLAEASSKKKKVTPREEPKQAKQPEPTVPQIDESEIIDRTLARVCDAICLANLTEHFGNSLIGSPNTITGFNEIMNSLHKLSASDDFSWTQSRQSFVHLFSNLVKKSHH